MRMPRCRSVAMMMRKDAQSKMNSMRVTCPQHTQYGACMLDCLYIALVLCTLLAMRSVSEC